MFSSEIEGRFRHLVSIYPQKRSALIPMLLLAQQEQGYVSVEAMEYIAGIIGISASEVESTMSFYTLLRRKPAGKYHMLICTNLACMLRGSDDIEACVKRKLGVGLGQVTADGLFSLEEVECMGACSWAPAVEINYDFHHFVTPEKLDQLIDGLRKAQ